MFLFDASITLLLAYLGYKYLPDYPHNTEWLDKREKEVALCRSQQQQQQQQESSQLTGMEKIKLLIKNKYLYPFMFGWACVHVAMGAAQVLGIVIKKLGFDAITANILTTVRSGI
jgi:ACS family pantothenate transporter-like MFS transporter